MTPEMILGDTTAVFAGFTVFCMGGCAILFGMVLARDWRPARMVLPFGLGLGLLDRFLVYALFYGDLLSPTGFMIDTWCIMMAALLGYRYMLARQLVQHYPWMYRRFLIFGWRDLPGR